jgi:FkbM family methyltransferase
VERIVDVGANVGAASVKWAVTYPHATIHAFEPGPAALGLLERNAAHFPSIVVHRFGLGAKDEERRLYHSRWDPMSASVCASAENVATFDMITVRRAASALQSTGLTSIDLLKIDTEGCEVAILDELAAIIAGVKCLYLEYHSDADRRLIDESLSRTHLLAFASVKHPHRGDLCYVHRDSAYCRRHALLAVVHPE